MGAALRRPEASKPGPLARIQIYARRLDRRRLAAIALAFGAGVIVRGRLADADAVVESLGRHRAVAVASVDLPAGHVVTDDDVMLRTWPVGLLPDGTIGTRPVGRQVGAPIVAGEPVVEPRLVPLEGPIRAGERGVTVPQSFGALVAAVGDGVELVGSVATEAGLRTTVVASGRVIAIDEESVTVATSPRGALAVIEYLASGTVDVILTPHEGHELG